MKIRKSRVHKRQANGNRSAGTSRKDRECPENNSGSSLYNNLDNANGLNNANSYRTTNHSYQLKRKQRRRRSRLPLFIALAVVIILIIVIGIIVVGSCTPSEENDEQNAVDEVAKASNVVMTLGGSQTTYVLVGEEYLEAGCHAVDPDEGDITSTITTEGTVDTSVAGTYTITYTATTSTGAIASAERSVHVVDSFDEEATNLPVLMYHYVYTEDDPPDDTENNNYLLDTKLEAQLKYLSENEYYYPSYEEVRGFIDGTHTLPAKSVVLTFDDGQKGFLKYGIPLLEKYHVPATSFIICNQKVPRRKF